MESQALLTTLVSRRLNRDILGAVLRAFRLEVWCLAPWNTVLSTEINICPNMSFSSNTTAFIVFYITSLRDKSCFLAVNQAVNLLLSCLFSRFRSRPRQDPRQDPSTRYSWVIIRTSKPRTVLNESLTLTDEMKAQSAVVRSFL